MKHILPALALAFAGGLALTSCDDMLDMGNDDMLYADENHLSQANDTVNSFVGILAQLQKIAVRTNLYGELRGDLSVVNANADADLKAIANFQVSSDNVYNDPRDYYAVINNCNYYLANADTTISETTLSGSGRTDFYPFRAEYVAVRTIRAWVYLQLGQVYGTNIPLVTKPILSLEDADEQLANAPKKDLGGLCDYFIDDLKPYVAWFDYPAHGKYNDEMPARMAVLPIQLVLGDLYLWSASIHNDPMLAREAAKSYYDYIDWVPSYGGVESNNAYKVKNTIGNTTCSWMLGNGTFTGNTSRTGIPTWFDTSAFGNNRGNSSEVIAAIGMDSASSEGYFNQLRYLYCYDNDHDTEASISPSQVCYDLSDNQSYMAIYTPANSERTDTQFVTRDMLPVTMQERHYQGDLRLPSALNLVTRADHDNQSQIIFKHYVGTGMAKVQDIIVYRTGDVYLRLAEALNYAGFPKFALCILTTGLDERVMDYLVLPQCTTAADSAFVSYFEFPRAYYQTRVSGLTFRNGVTCHKSATASPTTTRLDSTNAEPAPWPTTSATTTPSRSSNPSPPREHPSRCHPSSPPPTSVQELSSWTRSTPRTRNSWTSSRHTPKPTPKTSPYLRSRRQATPRTSSTTPRTSSPRHDPSGSTPTAFGRMLTASGTATTLRLRSKPA